MKFYDSIFDNFTLQIKEPQMAQTMVPYSLNSPTNHTVPKVPTGAPPIIIQKVVTRISA